MTAIAQLTAREAKKAAKKEFTLRGQLLTRIAQGVAKLGKPGYKLGKPGYWFSGLNLGPLFVAQTIEGAPKGHATRGFLTEIDSRSVCIQEEADDTMICRYPLGTLTTESLARLAKILA